MLELQGSEALKEVFLDDQNVFCIKCERLVPKKVKGNVKRHLNSSDHLQIDVGAQKKQQLINESNGLLVSNDVKVNSVRCIPCGNDNLSTKTIRQLQDHLNRTNHQSYIEAYEKYVQEDPAFNNWRKARSRVKNAKMFEMASDIPYMKVLMDEEHPFTCKYYCEKCSKNLRRHNEDAFVEHVEQTHAADSNGFDAVDFGRDLCSLFLARM